MSFRSRQLKGVLLLVLLMLCAAAVKAVLPAAADPDPRVSDAQTRLRLKELAVQEASVERNANLRFYGSAFVIAAFGLSLLLVASGLHRARVKRASVHTYRIGQYNEVVVHERDLSLAAPVAMGLMNAEQLKQTHSGLEKAFELYSAMADIQTRQIRELMRGRTHPWPLTGGEYTPLPPSKGELTHPCPLTEGELNVPSFRELLDQGELAPGTSMILGYEQVMPPASIPLLGGGRGGAGGGFVPRRGSFLDIYSAAVAGESGSGKTATLLFLIGSALIAMPVLFFGIDPHYPHPKSLGFKTKPLWEAGLMRMATYKDDMLQVLSQIERTIDRRLKQEDTGTTPVVLVIDELAFLSTTSIGPAIANTMERISMEGRKCAVYMLASSQTWLAAKTGGSSSVRDTLTSAYVHRIKPKQANLLLQDKEEADKVKKQVKHAGEALLVPVGSESAVVKIPFTTDDDMQRVADRVKAAQNGEEREESPEPPEKQKSPDGNGTPPQHPLLLPLPARAKRLLKARAISYGDIFRETGIAKSTMHNVVNGSSTLNTRQQETLAAYLERRERAADIPA